jgi:regulatory protein
MVDDDAFGRSWLESRDRARPRGERALRQELALKGLDRALVDELLAERRGEAGDEASVDAEAAGRLLRRNARPLERIADPRSRRQRAYALLARHGFDPDTCSSVVRDWFAPPDDTPAEDDAIPARLGAP